MEPHQHVESPALGDKAQGSGGLRERRGHSSTGGWASGDRRLRGAPFVLLSSGKATFRGFVSCSIRGPPTPTSFWRAFGVCTRWEGRWRMRWRAQDAGLRCLSDAVSWRHGSQERSASPGVRAMQPRTVGVRMVVRCLRTGWGVGGSEHWAPMCLHESRRAAAPQHLGGKQTSSSQLRGATACPFHRWGVPEAPKIRDLSKAIKGWDWRVESTFWPTPPFWGWALPVPGVQARRGGLAPSSPQPGPPWPHPEGGPGSPTVGGQSGSRIRQKCSSPLGLEGRS